MLGVAQVHAGQTWESTRALQVKALVHYRAPFTGDCDCVLPAGTAVVIHHDPRPGASVAACHPELYSELEELLIPKEDRTDEKYDGYTLTIDLSLFDRALQLRSH